MKLAYLGDALDHWKARYLSSWKARGSCVTSRSIRWRLTGPYLGKGLQVPKTSTTARKRRRSKRASECDTEVQQSLTRADASSGNRPEKNPRRVSTIRYLGETPGSAGDSVNVCCGTTSLQQTNECRPLPAHVPRRDRLEP